MVCASRWYSTDHAKCILIELHLLYIKVTSLVAPLKNSHVSSLFIFMSNSFTREVALELLILAHNSKSKLCFNFGVIGHGHQLCCHSDIIHVCRNLYPAPFTVVRVFPAKSDSSFIFFFFFSFSRAQVIHQVILQGSSARDRFQSFAFIFSVW